MKNALPIPDAIANAMTIRVSGTGDVAKAHQSAHTTLSAGYRCQLFFIEYI
jgi:hypothetical protein